MFYPTKEDKSATDWQGYTLILPAISVGNVGQLTTDLLISTLRLSKIGNIYSDCILPLVGCNPFSTSGSADVTEVTTAVEVFESKEHKLVVIQQRSPFVKGRRSKYIDSLMQWIQSCRFKQVFILTSVFAHERRDTQLFGPQTRYLLTPTAEREIGEMLSNICKWIQLEKRPSELLYLPDESDLFIPGSGIAKALFEKCCESGLAAAIVLIFCSEGDNIVESLLLASFINSYFGWLSAVKTGDTERVPWKIPPSWQLQYGSQLNRILY